MILDFYTFSLNESFNSAVIKQYALTLFAQDDVHNKIKNILKWDKITDADVEEMSVDDAIKLTRKRNQCEVILWVKGSRVDLSYGKVILPGYDTWGHYFRKSIQSEFANYDKAYLIKDGDAKFSTDDLRSARKEAKQGAIFLQKDSQESEKLIDKLKKELYAKRYFEQINGQEQEYIEEFISKYEELVALAAEIGVTIERGSKYDYFIGKAEDLADLDSILKNANKLFNSAITSLESLKINSGYFDNRPGDTGLFMQMDAIMRSINTFDKAIAKIKDMKELLDNND